MNPPSPRFQTITAATKGVLEDIGRQSEFYVRLGMWSSMVASVNGMVHADPALEGRLAEKVDVLNATRFLVVNEM